MVIAVTGPESSGKSTLSLSLSNALSARLATEYAREYLTEHTGRYAAEDVVRIAHGQDKLNQSIAAESKQNNRSVVFDTEMLVCKIWMEFRFGYCDPFIETRFTQQEVDLYVLCDLLPWEPDPLRESPDENERRLLFDLYHKHLTDYRKPFVVASGSEDERLNNVLKQIHVLNPTIISNGQ